jgi:hypothetical protein
MKGLVKPSIIELAKAHLDITQPDDAYPVEVRVSDDGKTLWVNVGPVCVLRICRNTAIHIHDDRRY